MLKGFAVLVLLLFTTNIESNPFIRPIHHSYACYGVVGLKQTTNVLRCTDPLYPRICIKQVIYGAKEPHDGDGDGESDCPTQAIAAKVPAHCCKQNRVDCIYKANVVKIFQLQLDCESQWANLCELPADRVIQKSLQTCSAGDTSTMRYVGYKCLRDFQRDLEREQCYTANVVVVKSGVSHPRTTTKRTTTAKRQTDSLVSNTDIKPKSTSPDEIFITPPVAPDKSKTKITRSFVDTTLSKDQGNKTELRMSPEKEKIIIGVSVSLVILVLAVITVTSVVAVIRRSSFKAGKKWTINNPQKTQEEIDNIKEYDKQPGVFLVQKPNDPVVYEEINESKGNNYESGGSLPSRVSAHNMSDKSLPNGTSTPVETANGGPIGFGFKQDPLSAVNSDSSFNRYKNFNRTNVMPMQYRKSHVTKKTRFTDPPGYESDSGTLRKVAILVRKCLQNPHIAEKIDKNNTRRSLNHSRKKSESDSASDRDLHKRRKTKSRHLDRYSDHSGWRKRKDREKYEARAQKHKQKRKIGSRYNTKFFKNSLETITDNSEGTPVLAASDTEVEAPSVKNIRTRSHSCSDLSSSESSSFSDESINGNERERVKKSTNNVGNEISRRNHSPRRLTRTRSLSPRQIRRLSYKRNNSHRPKHKDKKDRSNKRKTEKYELENISHPSGDRKVKYSSKRQRKRDRNADSNKLPKPSDSKVHKSKKSRRELSKLSRNSKRSPKNDRNSSKKKRDTKEKSKYRHKEKSPRAHDTSATSEEDTVDSDEVEEYYR